MRQCFLLLMLFSIQFCVAQDTTGTEGRIFKKIKVDVMGGYTVQDNSKADGGGLFSIEPKYAISDKFNIGLRLEVAATVYIDDTGDESEAEGNGSGLITAEYYFTNNKLRPFLGVGGGLYTIASVNDSSNTDINNLPTESEFGFMARTGLEFGHLRFALEYNFLKDNAGYLALKLGVVIGGGRK